MPVKKTAKSTKTTSKASKFNPIKEDKEGVLAKRIIWSTEALNTALKGIEDGRRLVANPFYDGDTHLLKGDLVFERTQPEKDEWKRCKKDIIYFAEKYCMLMTPEGIQHIKLRDYQVRYLEHLQKNRLSIMVAPRQIGKTVTSAIFMLWYICFNIDKNALIVADIRDHAVEILDKTKKIFNELPYFLKPGIYKWNESEIVLDNGCKIFARATTAKSGISFTLHCVLADEFAHVNDNIKETFYNNLFPTITTARARFIITSTQNGYELFYRLYMSAKAGDNEYAPFEVTWDQVPEWDPDRRCWVKRDENWHRQMVANLGSEEAFNKQYGISFNINANTLISQKVLGRKQLEMLEFEEKEIWGVMHSGCWLWKPGFEPMNDLRRSFLIITCDIGESLEQDYTVFSIYRLARSPIDNNVILECIGIFRSNTVLREQCALSLQQLIAKFCNQNNTLLSLERNTYGEIFLSEMENNTRNNKELAERFDNSIYVKYFNESGTRFTHGIKMTPGNKTPHCKLFKEDYERGRIVNQCSKFMLELQNFNNDGSDHYAAAFGHDDIVMDAIQCMFVKETLQYKLLVESFETFDPKRESENDTIYNPWDTNTMNNDIIEMGWGSNGDWDPNENLNRLNKFMNLKA